MAKAALAAAGASRKRQHRGGNRGRGVGWYLAARKAMGVAEPKAVLLEGDFLFGARVASFPWRGTLAKCGGDRRYFPVPDPKGLG